MAKKLSKGKRANLVKLVTEYAWVVRRDARDKLRSEALLRDCGYKLATAIW